MLSSSLLQTLRLIALLALLAGGFAVVPNLTSTPSVLAGQEDDDDDDNSGQGSSDDKGDDDDSQGYDDDESSGNNGGGENDDDDYDDNSGPRLESTEDIGISVACSFDEATRLSTCQFAAEERSDGSGGDDDREDEGDDDVDDDDGDDDNEGDGDVDDDDDSDDSGDNDDGHAHVLTVLLPFDEVCAEVVGGDYQRSESDTGPVPAGYASSEESRVLSLIMKGAVESADEFQTTYWISTDSAVFPVTGPSLLCEDPSLSALPVTTAEAQTTVTPLPAGDSAQMQAGSVTVQTYSCGVEPDNAETFDWFGECALGLENLEFTLASASPTSEGSVSTGTTGADGQLQFADLSAGTYDLDAIGAQWCHAEADMVDPQGQLVVEMGNQVNVWVFFCGVPAGSS